MARRGLPGVVLRVLQRRLLDLPERLVGRVVGQDVHDEALFDRLPHRVQVEGLIDVRLGVERPNISSVRPLGVAVNAK